MSMPPNIIYVLGGILIFGETFVANEFEDSRSRPCSDGGGGSQTTMWGGGGRAGGAAVE